MAISRPLGELPSPRIDTKSMSEMRPEPGCSAHDDRHLSGSKAERNDRQDVPPTSIPQGL